MEYMEAKATAVASFFLMKAGGELEDLKLMKLMYLAEREAIRLRNVGITADKFYSLKNGPVLSKTLDRLNPQDGQFDSGIWREHISVPMQWRVRFEKEFDPAQELSRRELAVLEEIWDKYGSWTKWQLVDHVHTFGEWQDPGGSRRAIAFQDILAALGFDEATRESRYAEHIAMNGNA